VLVLAHTYIKCKLIKKSFAYNLCCFIVVTKDERTLIVKPMLNNQYSVYNNVTKSYESLPGYHFNDFITAAAANLILCYRTEDTLELNPKFTESTLDAEKWTLKQNADSSTLAEDFNKHMSQISKPFKIGPYQLDYSAIGQLIELTSELNDEQLNAHLQVTTTLSNRILLFDSIVFAKYFRRGFQATSEILEKQWFKHNVILVPVHHLNHWLIFLIDITKKNNYFLRFLIGHLKFLPELSESYCSAT
jgi:hypothetical protein